MKTENPKELRTSDLYFAAYLQVVGVPMTNTDRDGKGKITFIFDTSLCDIATLKTKWFNYTGMVAGLPFANAIKSLKSVCHM